MKAGINRQRLAVGFLVLTILFSGYYSLFVNPSIELIREDGAAKWEQRMQAVRRILPWLFVALRAPTLQSDE
jgi:hypothetical protein